MISIKHRLIEDARSFTEPNRIFALRIGWSRNYDGIFSEHFDDFSEAKGALKRLSENGRILILGPGGGAKTILLKRLAKNIMNRGHIPVQVSLKKWTADDYLAWKDLPTYTQRVDFLLSNLANASVPAVDFESLGMQTIKVILVDGLNEVNSLVGGEIINALDEFVRFSIRTQVIVSDRLVRRDLKRSERWTFGRILPLSENEVLKHIPKKSAAQRFWNQASDSVRTLLRTPYFLDAFLKNGAVQATKSAELKNFFQRHTTKPSDLKKAARAAFTVYDAGTRTFPLARFRKIAGARATNALVSAGVLIRGETSAYFDHHLKHDFLAAMHVASRPSLWRRQTFNRITFRGSSFDTVVFIMEQLTRTQTDRFIRTLYDWNIYGAGYALSEGRHDNVSPEMSTVIHAMFAERRWDLIVASSNAADDVLHQIVTPLSKRLLAARDLNQVLKIISTQSSQTRWFLSWQGLFTAPVGSNASENEMKFLRQLDSVMGWTSANVLRRKRLAQKQQGFVRKLLKGRADAVIRWRAAHVLGKFPSTSNVEALSMALSDSTSEVQYGATRSIIELAARSGGSLAKSAFAQLAKAAPKLALHSNVVSEFQRALIIDPAMAPRNWARLALPAVSAFQQATATEKERTDWDSMVRKLIENYGY